MSSQITGIHNTLQYPNNYSHFSGVLIDLSREAQLFVGWVGDGVIDEGVGFHLRSFMLYLILPTYLT